MIGTYPCDRGMPTGPRGYHHFESSPNGVIVCRYCGAVSPKNYGYGRPVRPSATAPSGLLGGTS